jgi:predicted metalloendopeptidase
LSSVDYYQNTSTRYFKSYVQLITKITQLLNAPNKTAATDIKNILDFEIKLANISRPYEKNGGAIYQRLSLKKLGKLIPKIDWKRYFKLSIPVNINDTQQIGIYGIDYFLDVQELILSTNEE